MPVGRRGLLPSGLSGLSGAVQDARRHCTGTWKPLAVKRCVQKEREKQVDRFSFSCFGPIIFITFFNMDCKAVTGKLSGDGVSRTASGTMVPNLMGMACLANNVLILLRCLARDQGGDE